MTGGIGFQVYRWRSYAYKALLARCWGPAINMAMVRTAQHSNGGGGGGDRGQACYVFPADLPDPCRDKQCPPGARCVASQDGRTAHCECPSKCPVYGDHAGSRAVCGSDGADYRNICELRRAACNADTEITVRYQGKCVWVACV
ncbi:hypothetical protein B566_EDAN008121 [Ephemera danica]|nr:hypothetical protein B566_EDAN008121 [Ephemera danica]